MTEVWLLLVYYKLVVTYLTGTASTQVCDPLLLLSTLLSMLLVEAGWEGEGKKVTRGEGRGREEGEGYSAQGAEV